MHRKYVGLGFVLLLYLSVGCTNGPQSPISTIPTILIDHIDDTEETKVFVHGVEDHLFSNITIWINEEGITENFTYELHTSTYLQNFELNVLVWDKEKQYEYTGNIIVLNDNDQMKLEIVDDQHEEPVERSLPHTIIMERKE